MRLIDADKLKVRANIYCSAMAAKMFCELVDEQPTIDPVRNGRWIEKALYLENLRMNARYTVCSLCNNRHEELPFGEWNYCPSCGAKMDSK